MRSEAALRPASRSSLAGALAPLLALALAMAVGFTAMGSFSTVQEGAKVQMHLSDYALGLVQALGAAIPLALFSIPVGIMVDRFNRVRLLLVLAAIWTAGTALTAVAPNLPVLLLARMMAGIGTTGALTAALSLGADLCAAHQRGRAMLIVTVGKTIGMATAFAVTGALFGWFLHGGSAWASGITPWRSAHATLAVISAVLCLPLLLLREPPRREVEAGPDAPFRVVAAELWSRRGFLAPLFVGQVSVVMADAAAAIWAAPVLSRSYGLAPDQFASWMGATIFGSGLVGAVLGGLAADWGQKSGRRGGVLVGAVIAAAVGIPAALFPVSPSVPVFAVALGTLMLCGTITGLITSVALTVLMPNELRGLCIGAFIAFAGLVGFGAAPMLVAGVSGWLGGERHLGQALATVGVIVSAASALSFLLAIRRAPASAAQHLSESS